MRLTPSYRPPQFDESTTARHEIAAEFIRNREAHAKRNALTERARTSSIPPSPTGPAKKTRH